MGRENELMRDFGVLGKGRDRVRVIGLVECF